MKVTNGKKAATIAPDHPDVPLAYALLKARRASTGNARWFRTARNSKEAATT